MIRITDRTLSCIDDKPLDKSAILNFLHFLIEMDTGAIELSEKIYKLLSPLPEYTYILRIENAANTEKYPHLKEFVCRNAQESVDEKIRAEIPLDSTQKIDKIIARYAGFTKVRIQGLDCAMCDDYLCVFKSLQESFNGDIEFCPQNQFNCATALATEWLSSGVGKNVVTSFVGIGGFAPTEEVIMFLRENHLRNENNTYEFFPEMARLFNKITGENVPMNKPIIGSRIFHVESGVHVDGILKQPKCYEPFSPEIVGQKRMIVLGKQSGTASIQAKLSELNIEYPQELIPLVLEQVKTKALENGGEVSDSEFVKITKECQA